MEFEHFGNIAKQETKTIGRAAASGTDTCPFAELKLSLRRHKRADRLPQFNRSFPITHGGKNTHVAHLFKLPDLGGGAVGRALIR